MSENDNITVVLAAIVLIIIVVFILINAILSLNEFSKELRYLNCEIGRTSGREQHHYKKLRRKLWLSLLPFFKY